MITRCDFLNSLAATSGGGLLGYGTATAKLRPDGSNARVADPGGQIFSVASYGVNGG